jgi:hypothetical protein
MLPTDCCPGLACQLGQCRGTCLSTNASCTQGSQCCSGRCPNGRCEAMQTMCGSAGTPCGMPQNCCSFQCIQNRCQ